MATSNKSFIPEYNTGFGERSDQSGGGRFYRKDGRPNVTRSGIRFFDRLSWYHTMIAMPRWRFYMWLLMPYIFINLIFGLIYFLVGVDHLNGITAGSHSEQFIDAFFFSAQTFTTVGYGHVSPSGILTSSIASFEAFLGVLTFALASGLFYGRFSRPRSFLQFSNIAVLAPHKNGIALMFRTVPYKNNHLMEAEIKMTLGVKEEREGEVRNRFYPLRTEISKVNALILNWTVVHPIDEESPLHGLSLEEMRNMKAEVLVYLKAYDEGFSSTVIARTSYTAEEIVEGAKFKPMYMAAATGGGTILHIDRLNHIEKVALPKPDAAE